MSSPSSNSGFDPTEYIVRVSGQPYLPVAARIQWLASTHQQYRIETTMERMERIEADGRLPDYLVVMRSRVELLDGDRAGSVAIGHGHCFAREFADAWEKSETRSIGRALALLGFGHQGLEIEFEEGRKGDGSVRLADAPGPVRTKAPDELPTKVREAFAEAGITEDDVLRHTGLVRLTRSSLAAYLKQNNLTVPQLVAAVAP